MSVPMTVIGGYLGAGKTTLVNAFLAGNPDGRLAVVVNDFGSVNVDADLVRSRTEDTLELANGCVCCTLADGMVSVMQRLRAMKPRPDHVLVEVSGVGDPAAVARWADHPGFRRHGVLVCVDVETIRELAADRWVADTVLAQLRAAETLLLTKTDLVAGDEVAEVRRWLASHDVRARILENRQQAVGMLGQGFGHGGAADPIGPVGALPGASHGATHGTWSIEGSRPVPEAALRALLSELPAEVVRVKGVVRTATAPDRRTLVQAVGSRVDLTDGGAWGSGTRSSLVVIARAPAAAPEEKPRAEPDYIAVLRRLLGAGTR